MTRNTVELAAKETGEMNDLTEKVANLSQKFSTNLDKVKQINSQCEETHKQIVPLLDLNDPITSCDLNIDELVKRSRDESDEIDEMLKSVDIEEYENNARDELIQISTRNQQSLDAFDAETERMLKGKNDEILMKSIENDEMKKLIEEKANESNAIKEEINKTSTLITFFRQETNRVNAEIEDLHNNMAILDESIENQQNRINELDMEVKQAEDGNQVVKVNKVVST